MSRRTGVALVACSLVLLAARSPMMMAPASSAAPYAKVAIFAAENPRWDLVELAKEVCAILAAGTCVEGESVIAPTKAWTKDEFKAALAAAGVDAVIVIRLIDDATPDYFQSAARRPPADEETTPRSTATSNNLYDNVDFWSASWPDAAQPFRYPIYGSEGVNRAAVGVFAQATGDLAWSKEVVTNKGFVRPETPGFFKDAAKKVVSALKGAKLVR